MNVNKTSYRTIWVKPNERKIIQIIDQRHLPHQFVIEDLKDAGDVIRAIKEMRVRGAPLIGVAAAYGMYLALLEVSRKNSLDGEIQKAVEETPSIPLKASVLEELRAKMGQAHKSYNSINYLKNKLLTIYK